MRNDENSLIRPGRKSSVNHQSPLDSARQPFSGLQASFLASLLSSSAYSAFQNCVCLLRALCAPSCIDDVVTIENNCCENQAGSGDIPGLDSNSDPGIFEKASL